MNGERFFGTVVWFQPHLGYGFIQPDTMEKQLFVHFSQIDADGFRKLEEGQRVEFSIGVHHGKTQAENVLFMEPEQGVA
jgi:CspA family cold shock protein